MGKGQTMREPVTCISSMATRQVLAELVERYTQETGEAVAIESVGGVEAARRVRDGERFDVVILAADAIERLGAEGRLDLASRVDVALSGVAVAVGGRAARPDIGSEAAVREAVLAARSIGYSTGPSGTHLTALFERWGIADAIASRIVKAPPGVPVGALVARGEVELGFQQLSELIHLPEIAVVGVLPPDIQITTVFAAAVSHDSTQFESARALLAFLASAQADDAKRRNGMEPA